MTARSIQLALKTEMNTKLRFNYSRGKYFSGNSLIARNPSNGASEPGRDLMKKCICCLAISFVLLSMVCFSGCGSGNGTWTSTGGEVSKFDASPLVYDSTHNVLYAGCEQQVGQAGETAGRGVWKYDGGSWTDTGGAITHYYIASFAYDSTHNLLYAGCYKMSPGEVSGQEIHGVGVWKYNGKTWTDTGGPKKPSHVVALAYDSAHRVLYAACESSYLSTTGGVWKYDGKRWTDTGLDSSRYSISSFAYDVKHNLLYAGILSGSGVLKYTGSEWLDTGWGVSTYWVNCLAYDSARNLLYAGAGAGTADINHFGHSVWKYDGTNWTDTSGAVSNYSVNSLACDSAHNTIYASCYQNAGGKGVWKYDGTTWTDTGLRVSSYRITSLAYDSVHNTLYAGTHDNGVWKYDGH